jgi:hypothetical protein
MTSSALLGPANLLEVYQGATKDLLLTVYDSTGALLDLTGSRLMATVKCDIREDQATITKDSDVGPEQIEILAQSGATLGQATVKLTPEDTQTRAGEYIFDVWIVLPSGAQHLLVGPSPLKIKPSVTRFL